MTRLLVFLGLMAVPVLAQDTAARMDEYLASQAQARRFMGSVLVAQDGKIVLKKGYGMANLELDVPNQPETKHRLGSITKQFVATAILQLQEQGKLSVEDPVCKHMPDCPAAWSAITIHHLLSHTSGIPNFTAFPDYTQTWTLPSRPEKTILRFKDKPLDFQPGKRWSYSNSAYVLLGYLLERISGETYEGYLRKHIFDPAGMADSGSDSHATVLKNRADGYSRSPSGTWINSPYHDMTIPIGGGDLYSTVEDLLRWDQALTSGKLLSAASLQKMYTPVKNNYGYGWSIERQYGRLRYAHGGGINGFASFIARFPEQKAVIAVLGNMDFANSGEIANRLAGVLFDEKVIKPSDRKEITLEPGKLADYAGVYEAEATTPLTLSVDGEKLMTAFPGSPREQVYAEAPDRFFTRMSDRLLIFSRGADGKVNRLTTVRDGLETGFSRSSKPAPPPPKEITLAPEDLAGLPGEYALRPTFSIVVTVEDGKVFAQATNQPKFQIFPTAKDKFFLKVVEASIDFQRDAAGKVTQLTLHQNGQDIQGKKK